MTFQTSVPIGAWQCNFTPVLEHPTDIRGVYREVTLPIIVSQRHLIVDQPLLL